MIVIVDYGVGNLMSVRNMARKVGAEAVISGDPDVIAAADRVILPGVGHFNHGMEMLRSSGLVEVLTKAALDDKKPFLGICLGAQILGKGSEEGNEPGLGWIDMECVRFPRADDLPVPHMMWNELSVKAPGTILDQASDQARYYFVHSYYMKCADPANVVANTTYGVEFTSVVQRDNIMGMQFHPEKSLRYGMEMMRAFNELGTAVAVR